MLFPCRHAAGMGMGRVLEGRVQLFSGGMVHVLFFIVQPSRIPKKTVKKVKSQPPPSVVRRSIGATTVGLWPEEADLPAESFTGDELLPPTTSAVVQDNNRVY